MQTKEQFIARVLPWALETAQRTGLDPRLIIAQSALESGWGNSKLAQNENNYFGIKDFSGAGRQYRTFENYPDEPGWAEYVDTFATYPGLKQSFEAYENLLMNNDRYKNVRNARSLEDQITAMGESGFATDPNYARKLFAVANSINLNNNSLVPTARFQENNMGILDQLTNPNFVRGMTEFDVQNRPGKIDQNVLNLIQKGSMTEPKRKTGFINQIKDYLSDEGNRDKLALAFNSMTLNPDPGIATLLNNRIKTRQEMDYLTAQTNKTAQYFENIGRSDLAKMITQGIPIKDVMKLYTTVPGQLTKEQMAGANTLRDDVRTDLELFSEVRGGYETIKLLFENPGAVSDYALAVAFAKIVDPGSVAREGEVAAVQNAGAKYTQFKQFLLASLDTTGQTGRMAPAMRTEIAKLAGDMYNVQAEKAKIKLEGYEKTAQLYGVPFETIFMGDKNIEMATAPKVNTSLAVEKPEVPEAFAQKIRNYNTEPQRGMPTLIQQAWDEYWKYLTDEQRRKVLIELGVN